VTELFAKHGIRVEDAEVRRDMGLFKKDHIRKILQLPQVSIAWSTKKGRRPAEYDADKLFSEFGPLQMEILGQYSQVIAGSAETSEQLLSSGLRVGSTTGYPRPMLDLLIQKASSQGYRPEVSLCPDDVGGGRPKPWMCLQIAQQFRLSCVAAAVKVGDTVSDIQEGLNAGMWAVGISDTGNEVGLSAADLATLPDEERKRRSLKAAQNLLTAGAHYVIESVQALPWILEEINQRLAAGERPK
jgi:phosphonoacetaldehyde hydrolase